MLDGNAYRAHFPDDPDHGLPEQPARMPNAAALLAALAALEDEFRTILDRSASSADRRP